MSIEVIVQGQPTTIYPGLDQTIGEVRMVALLATGHPIDAGWEIRNHEGRRLDTSELAMSVNGGRLYINLRAGFGG